MKLGHSFLVKSSREFLFSQYFGLEYVLARP